jgi:aspartate aminotransferase
MKPAVSLTARSLPRNGIRAIAGLAAGRDDVIDLVLGEPDFPTPPHVIEAAWQAANDGETRYGPGGGLPQLRLLAAEAFSQRSGVATAAEQVLITAGAVQGIFGALRALLEAGQSVLVPDPGWPSYAGQCAILGLKSVPYPLDREAGFEPDLQRLEQLALASRARALIINTPGNPTGAVWSAECVRACVELAERHGLWLVSDEVYDEMVFDGAHCYATSLHHREQIVSVFSFSKTYAMTGWRVGYLVASREVATLIMKVLELEISCPATPSQHGALAALSGSQACVEKMRRAYRDRRDLATAMLIDAGMYVTSPRGAFYALADVSAAGEDSTALAIALARQKDGVACVPGDAFGYEGRGLLRLSLAASGAELAAGIARISQAVQVGAHQTAPGSSPFEGKVSP